MSIKKSIVIPIGNREIALDVDFSIIEKVERVYNCTAEVAAAVHLIDMMRIRRSHIAQIITLWVQGKTDITSHEVNEEVQTCSQDQLYKFAGMIQASILFTIRGNDGNPLITSEQFDKLINGEDLAVDPVKESAKKKSPPKKKKASPKKKTKVS